MEYYLAIKKEGNPDICDNMDELRGYCARWNKLEKDKYHMISLICGIYKNKKTNKKEQAHRYREQIGGYQVGGTEGVEMGEGGEGSKK